MLNDNTEDINAEESWLLFPGNSPLHDKNAIIVSMKIEKNVINLNSDNFSPKTEP